MLAADVAPTLHYFYVAVIDLLGRTAVPLLSLISGMLLVSSFSERSGQSILKSKLKTLIVPMIFWSTPMLVIVCGKSIITDEPGLRPDGLLEWANALFAITKSPANGPLHFLRDIFIMSGYGIAILFVYRRLKWAGILLALIVGLVEQIPGGLLIFRNQIASMYVFGLVLALLGHAGWKPNWPLVATLVGAMILSIAFGPALHSESGHIATRLLEHLPKIAMSFLIWRLAFEVASRPTALRTMFDRLEPHIFTIFCSHAIVAAFVAGLALAFGLSEHSPSHGLLLLAQIGTFIILGVALSKLLKPFPWLRGKAQIESSEAGGKEIRGKAD